jgi:hypothetical protein
MATSKTKSITAFFEPSKRLRVDAEGQAAAVSQIKQGAERAHELTEVTNVIDSSRSVSTTAKGSDMRDLHPLPGFEPPPLRGIDQHDAFQESSEASTAQDGKERGSDHLVGSEMSKEQKMRMELNKTIARAKRNLRHCEEHIAESQSMLFSPSLLKSLKFLQNGFTSWII